ncbi:acyl-CoA dehydrogenase family protein [Georgenia halophila]|uniref:Acyl-CoA dehydrogenase family protein n=1 Tax=Georgenia halophila TaxID=620889 RepID=A0ABP8KX20_9MICO
MLTDDLLATIRSRAARHDAENTFPHEDLEDLRAAGYLAAMVPTELGGAGLTLEEMTREQARLAAAAPATALAVNMHHVWVAVANFVRATGDDSCDFVLREAAAGEIFAFGVSEPGNDLVLFASVSEARPDGVGGYTFHGLKIFTSLAPVWTRLGTFGTDASGAEGADGPLNVWGFVTREGTEQVGEWDVLGMRASHSLGTKLDGAHAPADRVVRRIPPGPTADPFVVGIFSAFETLLAAVYTGVAERAIELATETVRKRTSLKNGGAPYSDDPDIRWRLADAAIQLDSVRPQLVARAREVDAGFEVGPFTLPRFSAVKSRATEVALDVVTKAVRVSGGGMYSNSNELSRLYRDVLAGLFHPSDDESVHGAWANALLGPVTPKES